MRSTLQNIENDIHSIPVYLGKCLPSTSSPTHPTLHPTVAYLELTPACNNRCPGCSNTDFVADFATRALQPSFRRPPLNGTDWERILDRMGPTVRFLNLTGGEATLHPDFEMIVTAIDRRGIDFAIFTNARWREPIRIIEYLSNLRHCKGLLISLHGVSAETHELFSGVTGSFVETVDNIALAVRAGLCVSTSTVITKQNISELTRVAQLSRLLGAQTAVFNRYLIPAVREEQPVGAEVLVDMVPTRNELRLAVQVIEALRDKCDTQHQIDYGPCIPQCFVPSSSQGCTAGETFFAVDPWGNVKPCTDAPTYCGNLLTQTIGEVWNSEAMLRWRGAIPTSCQSCAALDSCRTGCRAMALASGTGRDPLMTIPLLATPEVAHSVACTPSLEPASMITETT
jgi:radical SAM protein with 4Fe4S-binding SPASM domain